MQNSDTSKAEQQATAAEQPQQEGFVQQAPDDTVQQTPPVASDGKAPVYLTPEEVIAELIGEVKSVQRPLTVEEVAAAIRHTSTKIEALESIRTKLRTKFRKMASEM